MAFKTWSTYELLISGDLNSNFTKSVTDFSTIFSYAVPPIGSIIAYHISSGLSTGTIPTGWLDCNGQTISDADSPMNGQAVPNLNGSTEATKLFLKGSTTSGGTGGTTEHSHSYSASGHMDPGTNSYRAVNGINNASTIPPYFEVRWIIRIK